MTAPEAPEALEGLGGLDACAAEPAAILTYLQDVLAELWAWLA